MNEFFAIFVKSTFQNMDTLTIELRHEKAFDLLKDLESMEIIRLVETVEPTPQGVRLGSLAGRYSLPDDFNAPLDDLEDYQ